MFKKKRFIFLLKVYLQKHDLNTVNAFFCDVIECSIGMHIFIFFKDSIKILHISPISPISGNTRIRHFLREETEKNSGNQIILQVKRVKMLIEL